VLLLAGAFEPVDDAKAREARCDGVLVKPFEPQHVIARVRELIGGAKGSPTQSAVPDIPRPAARLAPAAAGGTAKARGSPASSR
jgi:DNA-binding response OmpR family regulator